MFVKLLYNCEVNIKCDEKGAVYTNSVAETIKLGEFLGSFAKKGMVFALGGDLAAGKTTLTKGIAKGLGVEGIVKSPTFNILKIYEGKEMQLYHIDAYRLVGTEYDLGLMEGSENALTVVEWPILYADMPEFHLYINLRYYGPEKRQFIFEPHGEKYIRFLQESGLW